MHSPDCWVVKDAKEHATATATKTGSATATYKLHMMIASFSATPAAPVALTLYDGTTEKFKMYVSAPVVVDLKGLVLTTGAKAEATLGDGGVGITGSVVIIGENR